MDESLGAWFKREILAHEASLLRSLSRAWSRRDEVRDLCQETYARVDQAALSQRPTSQWLTPDARSVLALSHNLAVDVSPKTRLLRVCADAQLVKRQRLTV